MEWISVKDRLPDLDTLIAFKIIDEDGDEYSYLGQYIPPAWFICLNNNKLMAYISDISDEICLGEHVSHWRLSSTEEWEEVYKSSYWRIG